MTHNYTHSSAKRLRERLSYSFYAPRLKSLCNDFVQRCDPCQKRRRITYLDRTPIKPIDRTPLPFMSIHVDVLGPLSSHKPMSYPYCLLAVDNHSRYPWIVPMKTVTAKTICNALIEIFSHSSLPLTLTSDNATVFSSSLNKEFLRRLGVSPIFISPLHSAANGLAERHIGTLKSMISKAAHDSPSSYHLKLPLIAWFLREVPNSTTGMAPWTLCHGFAPRGIAEIVKQHWSGEQPSPPDLRRNYVDYLQNLQENLNKARMKADETSKQMQARYAHYYNLRSRDKSFNIGDAVLILISDSTSKTFSQWHGPAKVIAKKAPYTYVVELNGTQRQLHASMIRPYYTRISTLICESASCTVQLEQHQT